MKGGEERRLKGRKGRRKEEREGVRHEGKGGGKKRGEIVYYFDSKFLFLKEVPVITHSCLDLKFGFGGKNDLPTSTFSDKG